MQLPLCVNPTIPASRRCFAAVVRALARPAALVGLSFALSALSALSACESAPTLPLSYSVAIDPTFTSDEAESIVASLAEWRASVPELNLDASIAACGDASPQRVCIAPSFAAVDASDDVVGSTYAGASDSATVVLYVNRIVAMGGDTPALREQTAAHEVGHSLGLKHTVAGELMAAFVTDQAPAITPADVAAVLGASRQVGFSVSRAC